MKPWYKEPWPWIVMAPPATAVIAGIATVWIAVASGTRASLEPPRSWTRMTVAIGGSSPGTAK